ncbi:MAG: DUF4384 domain-containing protein [Spirochaetales bacterium]|nr:DUF4384 domain-containing protein [Spirochaetales bacterium]
MRQRTGTGQSRLAIIFVIGLAVGARLPAPGALDAQPAAIRFSWALVYQDDSGVTRPIDYTANIVLMESGDRFRFYLKADSPCVVYLYLFDAQSNLSLLFPRELDWPYRELEPNARRILPDSETWYYLDDEGGIETFYLVVSQRAQARLEAATRRFVQLVAGRNGPRVTDSKYGVLDEVRRILKDNSQLSAAAEKPVAIAGEFRGLDEEYQVKGISVETDRTYVTTIRLAH